jgi:hypothetical protein
MKLKGIRNKSTASKKLAGARKEVRDRELERDKLRKFNMKNPTVKARALSPDPAWKKLTLKYKEEMILDWSISGGVVLGRRLSRSQLASALGLRTDQIDSWVAKAERAQAEAFEDKESVRKVFYKMVGRLMHHITTDRARAIQYADILDQELELILRKREAVELMPESNAAERNLKSLEFSRWTNHFKSISYHKIESLRVLFESTEAYNRFLTLFSGQKVGGGPSNGIKGILDGLDKDAEAEKNPSSFVDKDKAIELIAENQGPVLPVQTVHTGANRNPSEGFEGFVDPLGIGSED